MKIKFAALPLKGKLKLVQTITVGFALILTLLVTSFAEIWNEQSKTQTEIEITGRMIGFNASIALMFTDEKAATEILAALSNNPTIIAARLYGTEGEALAHYLPDGQANILPQTLAEARSYSQSKHFFSDHKATLLDVKQNADIVGYLLLVADLKPMWTNIAESFLLISLVMFVAFSISLIFGQQLAALISAPLISLSSIAQQVSREKNYSLRATGDGEDEIGRLVKSFNQMIEQIQVRDAELEQHRDQLENEVQNRTADLRHALTEAQAANVAKSRFLANMSHEIRTPMNGVIGMVDVQLNTKLTDEQKKMAHVIRDSAYLQLSILNDILDFSKIEAGKLELSLAPFSIYDLVENTWTLLDKQANQKQVEFSYNVDTDIPDVLEGDGLRLRQILNNLISNAIKFSSNLDRKGWVKLDVRVAKQDTDQVWVNFTVSDNGIGIDEQTQSQLFQSFQQGDLSTTRRYGGTGLGLVITRRLSEIMGGLVSVNSRVGIGSEFTVHLPFKRVEAGIPAENISAYIPSESVTPLVTVKHSREEAIQQGHLVLVAEDNETNQQVIAQQLGLLGLSADIASDGCEALSDWNQGDYALLLTDIHMPNMDGYQLTQAIRKEESETGKQRLPIIALTAVALKGEDERCIEVGMDDYISKPVSLLELKAKLEKWLPGRFERIDSNQLTNPVTNEQNVKDHDPTSQSMNDADSMKPEWDSETLVRMVGDKEAIHQRLLATYLRNAEKYIATINAALTEGDIAKIGGAAHDLKSTSRSVGAMQLGDLCQSLELAGKGGDGEGCMIIAPQVMEKFASVRGLIQQRFPDLS